MTIDSFEFKKNDSSGIYVTPYSQISQLIVSNGIIDNNRIAGVLVENNSLAEFRFKNIVVSSSKKLGGIRIVADQQLSSFNNVKVFNNTDKSAQGGGGIAAINKNPSGYKIAFDSCQVYNNYTKGSGGGIYSWQAEEFTISNSFVYNNKSDIELSGGGGGGVYDNGLNKPFSAIFENCKIYNNFTMGSGGGIYAKTQNLTINRSVINNNTSEITSAEGGGGVFTSGISALSNSVVSNNSAFKSAGGFTIENTSAAGNITNCSFYNNSTYDFIGAGGFVNNGSGLNTIRNSVFWNNKQGTDNQDQTADLNYIPANYNVQFTLLQLDSLHYGITGQRNIYKKSPRFFDSLFVAGNDNILGTSDDGLRLTTASPCINVGVNGWATGNFDAANNARIQQNIVDLGAYEGSMPLYATNPAWVCAGSSLAFKSGILNAAVYRWQLNSGTGWNNITDNVNYAGTNTAALTITNPANKWYGYKYRCISDGNIGQEYILKYGSIWTGAVDDNWFNIANWSCNKIPDGFTDVYVNAGLANYPQLAANATCGALTLANGASLTVKSGYSLQILRH